MPQLSDAFKDQVKAYFEAGYSPQPACPPEHNCDSPGKIPHVKAWQKRFGIADLSWRDVRSEFRRNRFGGHNISLAMRPNQITMDIDLKHDGPTNWHTLLSEHDFDIPDTPQSATGGGGFHIYFTLPEGVYVPSSGNNFSKLGYPGVEFKAHRGQVIASPSRYLNGPNYAWKPGFSLWDLPVAEIPPWLLEMVLQAANASPTPSTNGASHEPIPITSGHGLTNDQWAAAFKATYPEGTRSNALKTLVNSFKRRFGGACAGCAKAFSTGGNTTDIWIQPTPSRNSTTSSTTTTADTRFSANATIA
ncbi:MAG: bifunctional DNA primase/polymerase [SAR202 cluster bacterium]|jgi:hypothetical protein|nr:bifunctional DNA primase/polymerase [SAR202 cluster bacterium]